jgi:hypothetical protein
MSRARILLICFAWVVAVALLGACRVEEMTAAPGGDALPTLPSISLPTATAIPPTLVPSEVPTEATHLFVGFQHPTGVFSISLPDDWEVRDKSTEQRLLVEFLPPIGYGSRVTADITNEGLLNPEEVRALAEGYLRLRYAENAAYTEINRADLPDGRFQVTFLYDDGRGAVGRETVTLHQSGPYFVALRVFLSDTDTFHLNATLETMIASFSVVPEAVWGGRVVAINPSELRLFNTFLWRDRNKSTYLMGEVYNAAPADVTAVLVDVALCDTNGVVVVEATIPVALNVVTRGGSAPFGSSFEDVPEGVEVCYAQARAEPFYGEGNDATALKLERTADYDWRRKLVVTGAITNSSLNPVRRVQILIAVYDVEDHVIGYALVELGPDVRIAPGQTVPFEYVFDELGGEADHFVTWIQAEPVGADSPSIAP